MEDHSVHTIHIGELIVAEAPLRLSTLLGSCISVCIYSPKKRIGGMVHFALPKAPAQLDRSEAYRYGDLAVTALLQDMKQFTLEDPRVWQAKIIGGAKDMQIQTTAGELPGLEALQAGPANIELAREILAHHKIPVLAEDVGGHNGRKLTFDLTTGKAHISYLGVHKPVAPKPQPVVKKEDLQPLDNRKYLVIGASTGGTEALKKVIAALPANIPPTLIVQHIPAGFSKNFADRLNEICPFEVKEAQDRDEVKPQRVLIAPGGKQMKVEQSAGRLIVRSTDDAPVNRHKPSVDYLFRSVAKIIGSRAVGVILTGMGGDGAEGLLQLKKMGCMTIGQDEDSSVIYGMPRVAFEKGAVSRVVSLTQIPREIVKALKLNTTSKSA